MSRFSLPLRFLRREWRAGELRLLFVALLVAVASVTSVSFFTDRISQALSRQANDLLGADLVVSGNQPLPALIPQTAAAMHLQRAATVNFLSMTVAGDKNQLAEVKAVSLNYPLRGQLQIAGQPFAPGADPKGIPQPGTVWLDAQLTHQLGLTVGDMLSLGETQLKVAAVLVQEPDRSGDFFSIAPRLMMNLTDLPATRLIQVGSRVTYRLLVAGAADDVSTFREFAEQHLTPDQRLQGVDDARPEVRAALSRAQQFLGLAALVSVLLASVAVASSARRFTRRHLDACAVMRCMGATQTTITQIYAIQMLCLGLLAGLVGCVLGYAAQTVLVDILGGLVNSALPQPGWRPVGLGLLVALVTLLGFAVPPLLALKNVPTLRVLRRELSAGQPRGLRGYAVGLLLLAGLMTWQAGDIRLSVYLICGTLVAVALFAAVAYALVRALDLFRARGGVAWRFGFANIARRAASSVGQILALSVGIMALLLLTLVRGDLLASWQGSLPETAPNRFIINIQAEQIQPLQVFFAHQGLSAPLLYPMVRARLTAINGKPVVPAELQDDRARRLTEREFNLSWLKTLPPDNQLLSGSWWTPGNTGKKQLSIEQGIADTLGIRLGDMLTYTVGDVQFTASVASLRKVEWDSFNVNFYVIAAPGLLENYPASYITSFYLPETRADLLSQLVNEFPNLTVIDIAAIMTQVRRIIERVTTAVEYVFLFTVLAGLLVLYAAIQSTQDERRHESAILRTLGASRRQLVQGLISEFALLGLLSGLVAAVAASALAYVLSARVLHLTYTFNPWLWLAGMLLGVLSVGVVGAFGTRSILRRPPLQTLREV